MLTSYQFPRIECLDDIRPAIAGRDEFNITDKGTFYVVNYAVNFEDTFPAIKDENDLVAKIRRECRGIIFDKVTEKVISRPWWKFFNINERAEAMMEHINLSNPHFMLDKIDGSFIRSFRTSDGTLRWGTKMVAEEFENKIVRFITTKNLKQYVDFGHYMADENMTPIYEYTAPDNRIVVTYKEEGLTLLGIRHNITGEVVPY